MLAPSAPTFAPNTTMCTQTNPAENAQDHVRKPQQQLQGRSRRLFRLSQFAVSFLKLVADLGLKFACYGLAVGVVMFNTMGGLYHYQSKQTSLARRPDQAKRERDNTPPPPPYDFLGSKSREQHTTVHHHYIHYRPEPVPVSSSNTVGTDSLQEESEPAKEQEEKLEGKVEQDALTSFASLEVKIAQMIQQGEEALAAMPVLPSSAVKGRPRSTIASSSRLPRHARHRSYNSLSQSTPRQSGKRYSSVDFGAGPLSRSWSSGQTKSRYACLDEQTTGR